MIEYVTDTLPLLWYLSDSNKLSVKASKAFQQAEAGQALIYVSAVVLSEIFYANLKLGRPLDFKESYRAMSELPCIVFCDVTPEDILDMEKDYAIPEMHDRIIVGLSRRTGATLITNDEQIIASNAVPILW